ALLFDIERALSDRHRIGAGAPIAADSERHDIFAFVQVDVDHLLQLDADERDRRLAGEARGNVELCALARGVIVFVERYHGVVGRIGARRARPTDVEGEAGDLALGGFDVEAMLAPADDGGEPGWRATVDIERPVRQLARRFDRLEVPAPVDVEPLIVVAELIKRPSDALARETGAVRGDGDGLEARALAARKIVAEVFLDADHHRLRAHRQRQCALDRAAAGFRDIDDDARLQRLHGVALRQLDGEIGVAFIVSLPFLGELHLDGIERLVNQPGYVAGMAGKLRAIDGLQADRAGDVEPGRRRAIEKAGVERDRDRLAGDGEGDAGF